MNILRLLDTFEDICLRSSTTCKFTDKIFMPQLVSISLPYRLLLKSNSKERDDMALAHSNDEFRAVVNRLAEKFRPYHEGIKPWIGEAKNDDNDNNENYVFDCNLKIPPWICQPYYRLPPEEHKQMMEEKVKMAESREKKQYFDKDGNVISRKGLKKLKRLERRAKVRNERLGEICEEDKCANTKGLKCEFNLCRQCCRNRCFENLVNCIGHKIFSTRCYEKGSIDEKDMENNGKVDDDIMEAD